jgi:hypothetical protein
MTKAEEKTIVIQAAITLSVVVIFIVLLALDLTNRGLVWRMVNSLRSTNNSLPGEQRTVGDNTNHATLDFLA